MADTTFVNGTVVAAAWLNDINDAYYNFQATATATARTSTAKLQERVSVLDFGADPTGVADSTAAFNLANQSTVAFASVVKRTTVVPAGTYKITGPVYLRAGCVMTGEGGTASKIVPSGMASTDPIIRMGWGKIAGVATNDGSGLCPVVAGLFFAGTGTAIDTTSQSGYKVLQNWFACSTGVVCTGADGLVEGCVVDTATPVGMVVSGSRTIINNCNFVNPNYGIQFSTPSFTTISEITVSNCQFFACFFASAYFYSDAVVADVLFSNNVFNAGTAAGRQTDQRHFNTLAGATFQRIKFEGNSFDNAVLNDICISSGTGIVEMVGNTHRTTGIAAGGGSTALAHSILVSSNATLIVDGAVFKSVGGQSIRMTGATAKSRINDVHNFSCGLGGAGLAAEANVGDRAHIHFEGGSTDHDVRGCTTDSTALYAVGTYNFSTFRGYHNRSASTSWDTFSSTTGGINFGERHNGFMVPTVASVAGAITLPNTGSGDMPMFYISGTNTITSIVATGWAGKTVRLIFLSTAGLTDGSNLKLTGNFAGTADDQVVLSCDGTNWYEASRAAN